MAKKGKLVKVIQESSTGRNLVFQDKNTGRRMPLQQFVVNVLKLHRSSAIRLLFTFFKSQYRCHQWNYSIEKLE